MILDKTRERHPAGHLPLCIPVAWSCISQRLWKTDGLLVEPQRVTHTIQESHIVRLTTLQLHELTRLQSLHTTTILAAIKSLHRGSREDRTIYPLSELRQLDLVASADQRFRWHLQRVPLPQAAFLRELLWYLHWDLADQLHREETSLHEVGVVLAETLLPGAGVGLVQRCEAVEEVEDREPHSVAEVEMQDSAVEEAMLATVVEAEMLEQDTPEEAVKRVSAVVETEEAMPPHTLHAASPLEVSSNSSSSRNLWSNNLEHRPQVQEAHSLLPHHLQHFDRTVLLHLQHFHAHMLWMHPLDLKLEDAQRWNLQPC